jgi:hypothetical protein
MATYDASVKKALTASQRDLIDHKEHCSADPVKLATVGRERGHQERSDSEYGLYTVSQVRQESPDNIVRMGSTGRKRLGTSDEFVGSLDSQVPHPTFDDPDAETNNEFVARLEDDGTHAGLVVIAPHGGDIEPHTDRQAELVASRLAAKSVSLWRCKGFKGEGAFARWHIIDRHSRGELPRAQLDHLSGLHLCRRLPWLRRPRNPLRHRHWRCCALPLEAGHRDCHQRRGRRLGPNGAHRVPGREVRR